MPTLDNDTIVKIFAGFAVLVAAMFAAVFGLYSNVKIKRLEFQTQARKERAAQRLAFHIPLLRFCYELDGRIGRILEHLSSDWLRGSYLEDIQNDQGFAQDPRERGYFIISSVYVFACFFGWTEAIKKGIDATQPLAERGRLRRWASRAWERVAPPRRRVFFFDHDISMVRRLFQFEELFASYLTSRKFTKPKDACKLHRYFQHSIGEMMLHRDGNVLRCKTFREFYDAYTTDPKYRYWFVLLEQLFIDLSDFAESKNVETQSEMKNDVRPLRLLAIRYWCRILMRNLSRDLGIETPAPEEILDGRSEELKKVIKNVTIEELEKHLVEIPTY
jgi:hypothetical protein